MPAGGRRRTGVAECSGWHNLHGDAASSDEVSIALALVLRTD
jgi:hypothetical protein